MKKSFKKTIAALLATLMVVTAFPMSAFALPNNLNTGEWDIDIQLQFGTFHTSGSDWQDKTFTNQSGEFDMSGIYDVPLDMSNGRWDPATGEYKIGGLYIDKDKANEFNTSAAIEADPVTENIQYGVGDYFTTTVKLNVSELNTTMISLEYGDTIEPAGTYSYYVGRNKQAALGSESERAAANRGEWTYAGVKPLTGQDIYALYNGKIGNNVDDSADTTAVNTTNKTIDINFGGTPLNAEGFYDDLFVDPTTGNALGYTYNDVILGTFVFKIVKEGDISFKIWDPDNTKTTNYKGAYVCLNLMRDGAGVYDYNTYAKNVYGLTEDEKAAGIENPGSRKLTLMGHNINTPEEPTACDHAETTTTETVTTEPTCTTAGAKTVTVTCNKCNEVISTNDATIDVLGHDMTKEVSAKVEATCEAPGKEAVIGCSRCDYTEGGEAIAQLTHTPVSADNAKEPTCTEDGKKADTVCSVCGALITAGDVIAATGHKEYTVASNNNGTHTFTCTKGDDSRVEDCNFGAWVVTDPAAYKHDGTKTRTCETCGYVETATIPATDCTHEGTKTETLNAAASTAATCEATGTDVYDIVCDTCGNVVDTKNVTTDALGHDMTKVVTEAKAATCEDAGNEVQMGCTRCDKVDELVTIEALGHDMTKVVTEAKAATCEDAGNEVQMGCTRCDKVDELVTIEALGHDMTKVVTEAKAPTCTEAGNEVQMGCTRCDKVNELVTIAALDHTAGEPVVTTVPAEIDKEGSITTVVNCTVCGAEISKDVQTIPALVGYTVTVDRTDLGYVTLDGTDVSTGGSAKFVEGSKVTLTAAPVDGATFVGWTANGSTLVSTDTTFTTTVLANIKFTPVFEIAAADSFTVQYVDAYGNVVAIYTEVTADTVASIKAPEVPNRPGYTADGWSITDLSTVTSSVVISAQYVKNTADLYTVTVPEGATVMVDGAVVEAPYEFAFDTKVTVSLAGTDAWTIDGTAVGYGSEFTFYVTADVALEAAAGITATPSVALIGKESIGAPGAVQAMFKATRTMADGCKFVQAGFIYGKGNIGDAKLADVNGSTVKAAYAKTSVEQFSLTYGLRAQSGTIQARAFLAYVDAQGQNQVVYTPVSTYTYGVD